MFGKKRNLDKTEKKLQLKLSEFSNEFVKQRKNVMKSIKKQELNDKILKNYILSCSKFDKFILNNITEIIKLNDKVKNVNYKLVSEDLNKQISWCKNQFKFENEINNLEIKQDE